MGLFGESKEFSHLFEELVKFVEKSSREFVKLLQYASHGKDVMTFVKKIESLEREMDNVREKAEDEVYKGSFLPFLKTDRLLLMDDMDDLVDIIEETSKIIACGKLPKSLRKDFFEFSLCLGQNFAILNLLLASLTERIEGVMEHYEKLREERRKMKEKMYEIYRKVFLARDINPRRIDFTLEILHRMTVLHRKVGDVADRARMMVIKYL